MKKYETSTNIDDFEGSEQFPDSSGQLSTCRIDWRCQIQLPEALEQLKSTPKYQFYRKHAKIQQKIMINTDFESSRPEESFGAVKIVIRVD